MPSRRLTTEELAVARAILDQVRQRINEAAGGDQVLAFALVRHVWKKLMYIERGTPSQRKRLKLRTLVAQDGVCGYSDCPWPNERLTMADEPELDRIDPVVGYTAENTILMHHECHRASQRAKLFA